MNNNDHEIKNVIDAINRAYLLNNQLLVIMLQKQLEFLQAKAALQEQNRQEELKNTKDQKKEN